MADNKIYFVRRKTWRSRVARSSAHDWKSCNGKKPFEGSNPSFSAKKHLQKQVLFFFASGNNEKRGGHCAHLFLFVLIYFLMEKNASRPGYTGTS